mgnify:CR=1 FL=1
MDGDLNSSLRHETGLRATGFGRRDKTGIDVDRYALAAVRLAIFLTLSRISVLDPAKVFQFVRILCDNFPVPAGWGESILAALAAPQRAQPERAKVAAPERAEVAAPGRAEPAAPDRVDYDALLSDVHPGDAVHLGQIVGNGIQRILALEQGFGGVNGDLEPTVGGLVHGLGKLHASRRPPVRGGIDIAERPVRA